MTEAPKRRGRPPKARIEGAAVINEPVAEELKAAFKAKIVGHPAAEDLAAIVEAFKIAHEKEWNEIRNGPFYYGLEVMAACLNS